MVNLNMILEPNVYLDYIISILLWHHGQLNKTNQPTDRGSKLPRFASIVFVCVDDSYSLIGMAS